MERAREPFLARVERIGPREAPNNLLEADVVIRTTHPPHEPPITVGRFNFYNQWTAADELRERFARLRTEWLSVFRRVDAAQTDARETSTLVAHQNRVAIEDMKQGYVEQNGQKHHEKSLGFARLRYTARRFCGSPQRGQRERREPEHFFAPFVPFVVR